MTFTQKFDSFVCLGDSLTCEVDGFTITARIAHDDTPDAPDQRQDGFWPSLYPNDAGFIGAGNGWRDRFDAAQAKAEAVMAAWKNDEWFYCGIILSVAIDGLELTDHAASLWGIEANYPDSDNAYLTEVEALANRDDIPMLITTAELPEPTLYSKDKQKALTGSRLVDDYFFSNASRNLLLHPVMTDFLSMIFERPGVLTQSLRFEYGSQQAIHQDTAFVRMNAPMKLAAVWIALEDITPNSGELTYFPGSHTWEGYLFSGEFKHYDAARDGETQLAEWHQWILDEAKRRGVKAQQFSAKKGDILFWHAGLAHGGAPVAKDNQHLTRKSLVGHYCPEGVRPLYHYYKPGQRRFYGEAGSRYTTSYYK